MEDKAGAQISRSAFMQSFRILFILMILAGILTRVIPAGQYDRMMQDGRETINPQSFQYIERPHFPVWRWLTAPLEVLASEDGMKIIVIILFILVVGGSFALLDSSGVLQSAIARIVRRFEKRKYLLLWIISLFFMFMGAFFGLFEEVVPLIPIMVTLSFLMGWDTLVGLGMSILATNIGFSAAITNPFTIGLAQQIADLPMFSGTWLRVPIFVTVYLIFGLFLTRYARSIERAPESSPVYEEDCVTRARHQPVNFHQAADSANHRTTRALNWFVICLALIMVVFLLGPFVEIISTISLPLIGLLFLIAGIGASRISGQSWKTTGRQTLIGMGGLAPGIPLILMASSVKFIVAKGGIMDTILHSASQTFSSEGSYIAVFIVFFVALLLEFFVASASAKVFLMMPILFPLGDLVGLTRQTIVLAYCFGDGFTNMIYPTNAVLLISLGLASISYSKWLKWSLKLWLWLLPVVLVFLAIAVAVHYGPF